MGNASGAGKAARSLSRYVKENRTLVVTSVCAIVLVMLLENVLEKENMKLDAAVWWLFGEQLRQPWLTPIMESFSAGHAGDVAGSARHRRGLHAGQTSGLV